MKIYLVMHNHTDGFTYSSETLVCAFADQAAADFLSAALDAKFSGYDMASFEVKEVEILIPEPEKEFDGNELMAYATTYRKHCEGITVWDHNTRLPLDNPTKVG